MKQCALLYIHFLFFIINSESIFRKKFYLISFCLMTPKLETTVLDTVFNLGHQFSLKSLKVSCLLSFNSNAYHSFI